MFRFIGDEAAFSAAVKKALPDASERPTLLANVDELKTKIASSRPGFGMRFVIVVPSGPGAKVSRKPCGLTTGFDVAVRE